MSESANSTPRSATEQLADTIVDTLCSKGLTPAGKRAEVVTKLANGTATESDWKLWLDLPLMKEEAGR